MMTGMGDDGTDAMTRLRKQGGRTIAEAESTAVVWGMPGELVKNGGAEFVPAGRRDRREMIEWWSQCHSLSAEPQASIRREYQPANDLSAQIAALTEPDADRDGTRRARSAAGLKPLRRWRQR